MAARLRTLLLSFACIGMGIAGVKACMGFVNIKITLLTFITALLLQILSNFANDYGDALHGADSSFREGPKRAVQSGYISFKAMFVAVVIMALLSLIFGIWLLVLASKNLQITGLVLMLVTGLMGIAAAYFYTNGKKPYGYAGFGDLAVFLFFGIVAVVGTFYLQTGIVSLQILLPAISMGLLATGVLNINNMRDIKSDELAEKISIPVRIGFSNAKLYHIFLVLTALALMLVVGFILNIPLWFVCSYPFFLVQLIQIFKTPQPAYLDKFLKQLSLSLALLVLLFYISVLLK